MEHSKVSLERHNRYGTVSESDEFCDGRTIDATYVGAATHAIRVTDDVVRNQRRNDAIFVCDQRRNDAIFVPDMKSHPPKVPL